MMDGGVWLVRDLFLSPLWTVGGVFHRGAAWVDLLGLANECDAELEVRGIRVPIHRGQVGWSQFRLAERWGWSRTKVKAFLKRLEKEGRVTITTDNETTIITIVNYCEYQDAALERMQEKALAKTGPVSQMNVPKAADQQQNANRNALNWGTGEPGKKKEEEVFIPTLEQARETLQRQSEGYTPEEIKEAWSHFEATKDAYGSWTKDRARVRNWQAAMESRMLYGRKLAGSKNGVQVAADIGWPECEGYNSEKIRAIAAGAAAEGDQATVKKCRAWLAAHHEA
jgi:DNA-binding MarR family transcriptional regulator